MHYPRLIFPSPVDERYEFEIPLKGWAEIQVELSDGSRYSLCFYDPVRLSQTIEDELANNATFFTEVNLVVVPKVTPEGLQAAVNDLYKKGVFSDLKPIS